jgi:hypothetical protein
MSGTRAILGFLRTTEVGWRVEPNGAREAQNEDSEGVGEEGPEREESEASGREEEEDEDLAARGGE